ncbi:hypothetical protein H8R17_15485 [Streptomyces sp. TRM68367]|nr:hypothetical protein [Streptomyces sp. TRM68367]
MGAVPSEPSEPSEPSMLFMPSMPDEVWQRFLRDSEAAIRTSAPREPSAEERTARQHRQAAPDDRATDDRRGDGTLDAVGELWQPEERWSGPAWRKMDGTARRRRVARVLGTAAVIVVILGALSALPDGSGTPYDGPGEATTQQSEQAPGELPTAALPSAPADRPSPSVRAG